MPTGPVVARSHEHRFVLVGVVPVAITTGILAFAITRRRARW